MNIVYLKLHKYYSERGMDCLKGIMIKYKTYYKSIYSNREEKAKFIIDEYNKYLGKSLLDIGGASGFIKKYYKGNYTNVDIDPHADHVIDLEKIKSLPFKDRSFDTVVCTDVLEHLDNIHCVFDEICRIADNYLIVSLPNGWVNAYSIIGGLKDQFSKNRRKRMSDFWWTLQSEPMISRHKWFFSLWEANEFIKYRADKMNFEIIEYTPHVMLAKKVCLRNLLRIIHQKLWSEEDFINIYSWMAWWILRRKK